MPDGIYFRFMSLFVEQEYNEVHAQQPLIYSCSVMVCCAYRLSTALQGFSKSSRMSLDTPRAFHTGFSSDRFLITLFAGTAMLLCMRQRKNRVYNQNMKFGDTNNMLNQQPIHNDTWHVMSVWLHCDYPVCNDSNTLILKHKIIKKIIIKLAATDEPWWSMGINFYSQSSINRQDYNKLCRNRKINQKNYFSLCVLITWIWTHWTVIGQAIKLMRMCKKRKRRDTMANKEGVWVKDWCWITGQEVCSGAVGGLLGTACTS